MLRNMKRLSDSTSILWIDDTLCSPIRLFLVQPFSAQEDGRHSIGRVCDLNPAQEPAGAESRVIVLHAHSEQIAHVQQFQNKPVGLPALEQVAELLAELPPSGVAVGAKDGDEDIGVGARAFLITRYDNDLVFHGHEALSLAGKTLDEFGALEGLELVSFGGQRNTSVAVKDIPKQERQNQQHLRNVLQMETKARHS